MFTFENSFILKTSLLTFLSLIMNFNIQSQNAALKYGLDTCLYCVDNPFEDMPQPSCCAFDYRPNDSLLLYQHDVWQKNDFHEIMRIIANPSTNSAFSNVRWVTDGYQKKPFVLDSDINIPIAIKIPGYFSTIHIIPRFKFRIFQNDLDFPYQNGDQSLPVRTPSAMPGIAYYFTTKKAWDGSATSSLLRNKYFGIYAYHHSNGQDGPEIDTANDNVNLYNGNFSEGLVFEFIWGGKKIYVSEDNPDYFDLINLKLLENNRPGKSLTVKPSLARKELYWRIGYEWHPKALTNAVFDELNLLSRYRMTYNISLLQMPTKVKYIGDGQKWCLLEKEKPYEKWRHVLHGSFALDHNYYRGNISNREQISLFNLSKRLNIHYTCYYVLGESKHTALFGQIGYVGSDDYNIYLNESYFNLRCGIAFAFFHQP